MAHDLDTLLAQFHTTGNKKLPPVHLWQPEREGSIDIRIDSEGQWYHEGDIFKREALVELFASILRLEDEQYYLVTPAEKLAIQVDDVPFIIDSAQLDQDGHLLLITQTQQVIKLEHSEQWQLRDYPQGQDLQVPYVRVRDNLYARLNRAVYYQLAELALEQGSTDGNELLLHSGDKAFSLGKLND